MANRKNKPIRDKFIFTSIVCFMIMMGVGSYLSYKTFLFAKSKTSQLVHDTEDFGKDFVDALGEHLAGRYADSPYMDSIKNIQPTTTSIPISYFYCAGFKDYYRMPLLYPYSIVAINGLDNGSIYDETGIKNVFSESNSSKEVINSIIKFAFNNEYLIAETNESNNCFISFHFKNGDIQRFGNKEELMKYIHSQHNIMPDTMLTIKEYYSLFR